MSPFDTNFGKFQKEFNAETTKEIHADLKNGDDIMALTDVWVYKDGKPLKQAKKGDFLGEVDHGLGAKMVVMKDQTYIWNDPKTFAPRGVWDIIAHHGKNVVLNFTPQGWIMRLVMGNEDAAKVVDSYTKGITNIGKTATNAVVKTTETVDSALDIAGWFGKNVKWILIVAAVLIVLYVAATTYKAYKS